MFLLMNNEYPFFSINTCNKLYVKYNVRFHDRIVGSFFPQWDMYWSIDQFPSTLDVQPLLHSM